MRTFELYCNNIENVENYEKAKADNFEGWDCHHRLETHTSDEQKKKISNVFKSLRWFNNGERNIRAKECPEGFLPGRMKKK